MMRSCPRLAAYAISALLVAACGNGGGPAGGGELPEGVVAAAGSAVVSAALVERIAEAQALPPREAATRAVADALLASEAAARSQRAQPYAERVALSRMLLQALREEARAKGPPTDAEVNAIRAARWWELDRPAMRRTIHAVVMVDENTDDAAARAAADSVVQAVRGVDAAQAFYDAAKGVKAEGLKIRVENLSPVARDGRALDPRNPPPAGPAEARYADDFVRAVFAIPSVGAQSPVTKSEFGYHVILLTEELPEQRLSMEEARQSLSPEVMANRARRALDELKGRLRRQTPPELSRSALEWTEQLQAAP